MKIGIRGGVAFAFFLGCWNIASADPGARAAVSEQALTSTPAASPQEFTVAERKNVALDVLDLIRVKGRTVEIHEPDASFLKLHFSRFNIPKGVTVEVRSPDGRESYRYTRGNVGARTLDRKAGDDGHSGFSAMSISGDTAIVEVLGNLGNLNSLKNRVHIDHYMAGYPEDQLEVGHGAEVANSSLESSRTGNSKTQSVCGIDQRVPAVCWEQSDPVEFDRSWPVARLLINGSKSCTAWRVGPDNLLFTNNHCVNSQESLETVEVWFNYQAIQCGRNTLDETVKVPADTLFATHYEYDFTLFSVHNFEAIEPFGYLGLDVRDAQLGERIYIPQHGYGYPKQIAIESDMNVSGLCEVDDLSVDRYAPDTDIGYFCDSVGGSSGSPVLAGSSNRAIALHHFGGCVNSGVKMSLIWPEVSDFFGGQVPAGDNENGDENLPPVAQFGVSCAETACSFDAGSSADSDGTISDYSWSFGDGNTGSGVTVDHDYAEAGSYNVILTVVDDQGASNSLAQMVSVEPANQPPVATFAVSCDELDCSLDASASLDADGSIVNYEWTFGDGNGATFDVPAASHRYAAGGQYPVQLRVTDDGGATATAETLLTVTEPEPENQLPQASFTFNCQELACSFDGSASVDPDGTISGYTWSLGDGSTGAGMALAHGYAVAGSFNVTLTVVDDLGASNSLTQTVSVAPANQAPFAAFQVTCDGLGCALDASGSSDVDGSIASYAWTFGDGTSGSGMAVVHDFASAGSYSVTLTVVDDLGASNSLTQTVSVEPVNQAPIASFQVSCDGLGCTLDASASTDPDGSIVSYEWTFGDGTGGNYGVPTASHNFPAAGQYTVRLQVTDNDGATATSETLLTVSEPVPDNELPQASFTFSCIELECSFDGGPSVDPDGAITSYYWDFGDGTTGFGERIDHAFGADGTYLVRLTVSDDLEASSSTTRTVEVVSPVAANISLSTSAGKYRGKRWVDLDWNGAVGSLVDIYRNGAMLTTTSNDGSFRDSTFSKREKRLVYQVCEQDTSNCSDEISAL